MTVQCIACVSFSFSRAWNPPYQFMQFAESGFGICAHKKEPGRAVSATFGRECDQFAANDEQQVARLRTWLQQQSKGKK